MPYSVAMLGWLTAARVRASLLQSSDAVSVVSMPVGQDLQRDVTPEPAVPGAVHLAHPAGAERVDDVVRAQMIAALQ